MTASSRTLLTVGEIARRLGQRLHRIEYVIQTRDVEAVGWAGHARVFSEADLEFIAGELRRIDEEKGGTERGQAPFHTKLHGGRATLEGRPSASFRVRSNET